MMKIVLIMSFKLFKLSSNPFVKRISSHASIVGPRIKTFHLILIGSSVTDGWAAGEGATFL